MAEIVSSEAYQLSSRYEGAWNPTYERYFARRQASRMDAEVLYDSMAIALGTVYPLPLVEESARALGEIRFALQLPDVVGTPEPAQAVIGGGLTIEFLDAFLRGDRNLHPRSSEVSILQALQSMNNRATLLQIEISAERGELEELLEMPDDALATALYLRMLGRFPADFELAEAAAHLREGPRRERAKDLAWALLNKVDFLFNY